ncbi:O-methyltransferase [Alteribacillus sp. HJP-4]|uniref:O-methyltransferase n=1 Tax=Alteribacillus sp. HJP-4 TaxID=2775394 RepID=UPI0035CD3383
MNNTDTIKYLQERDSSRSALFEEMEQTACKDKVPIIEYSSLEVIKQLIAVHGGGRVLEIGTAIGYSALQIVSASRSRFVLSIEKDKGRFEQALKFRDRSDFKGQTEFIFGDALDKTFLLEKYSPFDVLFIDAAKGKNQSFFTSFTPYLSDGGMVITDNVLFKGYTVQPESAPKRLQPMVKKIQEYNDWLMSLPDFTTRILPVGDGLAVSVHKGRKKL